MGAEFAARSFKGLIEMADPVIQLIVYDTLLECMAAFFDCDASEVQEQEGVWEWADWDGERHTESAKEVISTILAESKVWAWVENKSIVHLWKDKEATQKQILNVLAHEIGHTHRPYHKDSFKEEQKAEKYAEVASLAFDMMKDL